MTNSRHPETLSLHAGWRADPTTGSVAVPIHQTTSYQFRDTEHAANLFALKELGNIYTRIMNPTVDVLEQRIAALEGGVAALAVELGPGGLGLRDPEPGAGGRQHRELDRPLWRHLEPVRQHAEGPGDRGPLRRSGRPARPSPAPPTTRTRAYYAETLPNPKLAVFPIAEVAAIGRELGIPLIVDNTAAPLLCGRSIMARRSSSIPPPSIIGGHGTSIGGLIVDGGNFDWEAHPKRQPTLNTPDPSYHGAVWTEAVKPLGPIAYIIKARVTLLRDLGAALSPFNAFLILQGIETLALRMERHVKNAQAVADFLAKRPEVAKVIHPVAADGRGRRAGRRLPQGRLWRAGRLRAERRRGGRPPLHRFAEAALSRRQYRRRAQPRDPSGLDHALASSPRRSSSRPASRDGYVRLSIGIEHIDDILADLVAGARRGRQAEERGLASTFLPIHNGEVSASYADGGVMSWSFALRRSRTSQAMS